MHEIRSTQNDLISTSIIHIGNIVNFCFEHGPTNRALIVSDQRCPLARVLGEAYRHVLPAAQNIDFDQVDPRTILAAFNALRPGDLVVLVQSTNFRLEAYRLRVELFKLQLKVIEHPHLERMSDDQVPIYIDALAYDPAYYRYVGPALKARIDAARSAVVDSGDGARLIFDGPLEAAKLNIGDYRGMTNAGGQFPIGEVFTEAQQLQSVHGQLRVAVFGDTSFRVNRPDKPIVLTIEQGRITAVRDSTAAFDRVLEQIRADEGEIWLRELGFGLNRAFSNERIVNDIGSYERMCGVHLSLGAKHGQYNKPDIRRAAARYHIDVFAATEQVLIDDTVIYQNGMWTV